MKEENSAVTDLESDIDSMVSVLQSEAPPAPDIKEITKTEEIPSESKVYIEGTRDHTAESMTLLISRGARLILFLPIIVVVLFGLAQSYRSPTLNGGKVVYESLFLDLSFSKSVYLLSCSYGSRPTSAIRLALLAMGHKEDFPN